MADPDVLPRTRPRSAGGSGTGRPHRRIRPRPRPHSRRHVRRRAGRPARTGSGDERGEGVISAAIAVLIMAFIGVAAFVAYRGIMGSVTEKTNRMRRRLRLERLRLRLT